MVLQDFGVSAELLLLLKLVFDLLRGCKVPLPAGLELVEVFLDIVGKKAFLLDFSDDLFSLCKISK